MTSSVFVGAYADPAPRSLRRGRRDLRRASAASSSGSPCGRAATARWPKTSSTSRRAADRRSRGWPRARERPSLAVRVVANLAVSRGRRAAVAQGSWVSSSAWHEGGPEPMFLETGAPLRPGRGARRAGRGCPNGAVDGRQWLQRNRDRRSDRQKRQCDSSLMCRARLQLRERLIVDGALRMISHERARG